MKVSFPYFFHIKVHKTPMGGYSTRESARENSLVTNLVFSRGCEEFDNQI
jgi:hypothetical protein